jgi:hypothetical protein
MMRLFSTLPDHFPWPKPPRIALLVDALRYAG